MPLTQINKTVIDPHNSGVIPIGGIIMWSGSTASVPNGWLLCDGANGTPDLRNRFVVGAGSTYAVGATGGSADAIVVAHTHTGTTSTNGNHSHIQVVSGYDTDTGNGGAKGTHPVGSIYPYNTSGVGLQQNSSKSTVPAGEHNHTFTSDSTGSSGTNANLPPYYALAYIMRTG
jgi:hypothetical protein